MSTRRKIQLVNLIMISAMIITFFIFIGRIAAIPLNDNFGYTPIDNSLKYVSYEDYKTFTEVADTLDIKYEFSSEADKKQFAKSMQSKKVYEDQINKMAVQAMIIILVIFVIWLICIRSIQRKER